MIQDKTTGRAYVVIEKVNGAGDIGLFWLPDSGHFGAPQNQAGMNRVLREEAFLKLWFSGQLIPTRPWMAKG
jgi:hypothetical protein